jgi:phosphoribosylformimino-5-aminoimidazole carboxamide ribotide isomerase
LILSGGVSSMSDIENIKKYESEGIMGIISGRAIYDGRIDPTNALNFLCD